MTQRRLAIAAALIVMAAGASPLSRRTPSTPSTFVAPMVTATATATPTVTSSPLQKPPSIAASEVRRTALRFAVAASNWSAQTYDVSRRRRARLSTGPLHHSLRQETASVQLRHLRVDRASRLGAVVRTRVVGLATSRADVRVDVDELQLQAGRRTRQRVNYQVRLRSDGSRWLVIAFGATASGTP